MKKIFGELERVELLLQTKRGEIYLDKNHKVDLEWWVLGRACRILITSELISPFFAENLSAKNQDPPDFVTFDKNEKFFRQIEITEVMPQGRRRSQEYRGGDFIRTHYDSKEFKENPWLPLKKKLKDKLLRTNGNLTWLVVYFNILYSKISPYGTWNNAIIANTESWLNNGEISFHSSHYEKILVLDSNGKAMVELSPNLSTI